MMPLVKGQITGISPNVPARRRAVIIQPLPNGTDYLPDDQSQGLGTKTIYCDATTGVWQYDLPSNGEHTCYLVNTESGSEFIKVPDTENQRGWWWDYEIPSYYGGQFELDRLAGGSGQEGSLQRAATGELLPLRHHHRDMAYPSQRNLRHLLRK
jgi:hypothetical protein